MNTEDIDKIVTTELHRPKEEVTQTTYILIGVFCFLFVVLLVYLFIVPRLMRPATPKYTTPTGPTPTSAVADIIISTPTPTIFYFSQENLRIKIINSSGVSNQAAKIKQSLSTAGFTKVETLSSTVVTASKNQINFSASVSPESRQRIVNIVESIAGPVGEIESPSLPDIDVLVTTTFKQNN